MIHVLEVIALACYALGIPFAYRWVWRRNLVRFPRALRHARGSLVIFLVCVCCWPMVVALELGEGEP